MLASIKIAVASARPNRLRMARGLNMHDAKPVVMIAAAAVITLAVVAMPSATAVVLSPVRRYSSRMREMRNRHLVVHGQPEEDGEQHHRRERLDRPGPVDPDQLAAPPPLEHSHHHALDDGGRTQFKHRALHRHKRRAEPHETTEEQEPQHEKT